MSVADGRSGITMRAPTKSTTPSPLRSWKAAPILKKADSDAGATASAGAVRAMVVDATRSARGRAFRMMGPLTRRRAALSGRPRAGSKPAPTTELLRASELESDGEFRLARRRVDVRQQR